MEFIEEVKQELTKLIKSQDPEMAHIEADELLCSLLNSLGYNETISLYNKVPKNYG